MDPENSSQGSPGSSDWNHRPRLLHNYGASLLTIAHETYRKAAEFDGPLGSLARTLASMASPIARPLQHRWLSILSFFDDQILAIEDVAMTVFPPSAHVFNKIDELALLADSLPKKLDDATDCLVTLIHQLPLFDWAWMSASTVLKPFFSESGNSSDEMDVIDIKCDEQPKAVASSLDSEEEDRVEEITEKRMEEDIKEVVETCNEIMEALEEMGMVEEKKGNWGEGDVEQCIEDVAVAARDQILDLFDEGWQLKPFKG